MSKKARTAKQNAATRKMIAANKAARKSSTKKSTKKSSKGRGNIEGRVSNLERRVSDHGTRIGRVEKTVGGIAGYLMDTISAGVLPPVRDRKR